MSKSSFLFGVIVGGVAATAAAIKVLDTTASKFGDKALDKLDDVMANNNINVDNVKDTISDLKEKGYNLVNNAQMKFDSDNGDEEEDFIVDARHAKKYEKPTEVFMPQKLNK